MPRYYCDYCDTYLTHDSPSVRKQHNAGYKHKANVRSYYQQFEEQQTQSLIDQRIKEHLGQYGQVGGAFAAWPRPPMVRPPILPAPGMPGAIPSNAPMMPVIRPPILPRPGVPPGYGTAPGTAPVPGQPGVPVAPTQPNGPPGTPMSAPGSGPMPLNSGSNGGLPTSSLPAYQASPASGGFGTSMAPTNSYPGGGGSGAYPANSGADGFGYAQAPNNH